MNKIIKLNIDDWVDKFKPIKNHLDDRVSFNGTIFETYGKEIEFVREQDENKIWTYIADEDGGDDLIIEGFHFVNRLGYFITKEIRPNDGNIYEIVDD